MRCVDEASYALNRQATGKAHNDCQYDADGDAREAESIAAVA